jgi:hypothetical protein
MAKGPRKSERVGPRIPEMAFDAPLNTSGARDECQHKKNPQVNPRTTLIPA